MPDGQSAEFVPRAEFEARDREVQLRIAELSATAKDTNTKVNSISEALAGIKGQLTTYQKVVVPVLTLIIGLLAGIAFHFAI